MERSKAWISLTGANAWCVGQVSLHNSKTEWVCEESVRLPKESTVADLLALLAQQLQVSVNIRPTTFLRRISTEREYGRGIHGVELQGNEKVAEKRGIPRGVELGCSQRPRGRCG